MTRSVPRAARTVSCPRRSSLLVVAARDHIGCLLPVGPGVSLTSTPYVVHNALTSNTSRYAPLAGHVALVAPFHALRLGGRREGVEVPAPGRTHHGRMQRRRLLHRVAIVHRATGMNA